MKAPLQLSVLDQSPIREGGTATEALQETIALAVAGWVLAIMDAINPGTCPPGPGAA